MTKRQLAKRLDQIRSKIESISGLRQVADREDFYGEVCLACMRQFKRYRNEWSDRLIFGIAWKRAADLVRRASRRRFDALPSDGTLYDKQQEFAALTSDQKARLQEAMDLLPEKYRSVIRERFWNDKSCREIAEESGRCQETVKTNLRRAKMMLSELPAIQSLRS